MPEERSWTFIIFLVAFGAGKTLSWLGRRRRVSSIRTPFVAKPFVGHLFYFRIKEYSYVRTRLYEVEKSYEIDDCNAGV